MSNEWLEKDRMELMLGGGVWVVRYQEKEDIFLVYNQIKMIPTHEELGEMIQELCKTYDFLSEKDIEDHNSKVWINHYGEDEVLPQNSTPKPKKVRKPASGFIYLIKYSDSSRYKIGLSVNPIKRLDQLQTSVPDQLHLVHTIKVDDMIAGEAFFHLKYQSKRVRGEWFELSEQEVKEFCGYKDGDV